MTIRAAEQVMLSVRVAEVQRSVVKQIGLSTDVMWENGDDLGRLLSGVIDPVTGTSA